MTRNSTSELRLSGVLRERLIAEKNYVALADAISAANTATNTATNTGGKYAKPVIDRRKLKKIVEADASLVLSIRELEALDRYLEPLGHGLAYNSIFQRPNVLESLANAGHPVTFLLGSKPSEGYQLNLSHWDVKGLAEIQRGVNKFAPNVRFDIRDVLLHSDVKDARRSIGKGGWMKLLNEDGPSLVCLGSGRANHAAEAILCKMWDVPTFDGSEAAKRDVPFHFLWPDGRDHVFPSAFQRSSADTPATGAASRALKRGVSALATATGLYVDKLDRSYNGVNYGVCVAQRRSRGQIWVVLAGISGPATFAVAQLANRLAFNLQAGPTGEDSPVLWAVIECSVRRDDQRVGGNFLVVTDQATVSGPHEWRRG
jgi:hypothetical protein